MQDAGAQQVELCAAIHLPLEEIQSVDLAFDLLAGGACEQCGLMHLKRSTCTLRLTDRPMHCWAPSRHWHWPYRRELGCWRPGPRARRAELATSTESAVPVVSKLVIRLSTACRDSDRPGMTMTMESPHANVIDRNHAQVTAASHKVRETRKVVTAVRLNFSLRH